MFWSNCTSCGCKNIKYFKTFSTQADTNRQIISDILGIPRNRAKFYIEKHKIQNKDGELLVETINFCKKIGYSDNQILVTPRLLSCNPLELEQHYYSLKEGGFDDIGPHVLSKARTHMKKIVHYLKSMNLIPLTTNVAEKFISCIEDKDIAQKISANYTDKDIWKRIHLEILKTFLRLRLGGTEDEITNLLAVQRIIINKSFQVIQQNIRLAEELGFEPRKIIKYGYLLGNYPGYPEATLRDLHNLAGINMKHAMRVYPKLMTSSPKQILKIYGILKEFDISDETIQRQPNVFHMSPETVRVRLQEIEKSPDMKMMLTHPGILGLIIHNNRAKTRLSYLQQLQLRCAPFSVLRTGVDDLFEEYVKEGKDVNKSLDLLYYLQKLFSVSIEDLRKKISVHPFYLRVPLKDMQETYNYLISKHFSSANIYKVVYILLYPQKKVKSTHATIKHDRSYKYKSLNQVNKLNLMLYLMEKEHHFTGNGIWRNFKVPDESTTDKTV